MTKHIEMIIDYITDGTDYQYNDNHGVLVRCRDCIWYLKDGSCARHFKQFEPYDFCSYGERGEADDD